MKDILLPQTIHITQTKGTNNATIVIEPCHPGYGVTLGNALRRVLLSSLDGAAVVGVKIKGIQHEFSTIPNVKEDVIEIILNLKQLRLKVFSDDVVCLKLYVKGEKKVKASDIEPNSDVEIVTPDLLIATMTHKDAKLEMDIYVSQGRGFITSDNRQEDKSLEVGVIGIDSIFTPIRRVGYRIEEMRVGKMTDYERLIMELETDGTVTPKEAIQKASKILINHFKVLSGEQKDKTSKQEISDDMDPLLIKNKDQ